MMAPGLPDLASKYGITSPTILALTLSIFLLSFAIGPLFLGPLSEMYGRTWVCLYSFRRIPPLTAASGVAHRQPSFSLLQPGLCPGTDYQFFYSFSFP